MNCYICNGQYKNIMLHARSAHPNFSTCFEFWKGATEIARDDGKAYMPPSVITPRSTPVEKLDWGYDFEAAKNSRQEWIRYKMSKSSVVPHLKPILRSYFVPNWWLPNDFFGEYPESLVTIRMVSPESLDFDLISRMFCEQCGGYSRKRHCPPSTKSVSYYEKWVLRWKACYILVWQSDGRAGWTTRPGGIGAKRWGRGLRGVDNGLGISTYKDMKEIVDKIKAKDIGVYLSPPGPCKICKRSPCMLPHNSPVDTEWKGCCRYPIHGGMSPEAMGVDVMGLLWGLNIPTQLPVFDFITKLGIVFTKEILATTADGRADL